ncbi:MAG: NAD-binding protein [Anaerolineales bacterium]|nr:NAD-binding protein [Anaerolineales bacterium]
MNKGKQESWFSKKRSFQRQLQHWLRSQWRTYRWFVIGALWLVTLAMGYAGFSNLSADTGQPRSFWDLLYLSIQLFTLESGSAAGPKTWELEAARLFAPSLTAFTAVEALALVFREHFQLLQVGFLRNHIILCGLGRKGYLLAQGFRKIGAQVVIIEQDTENDFIQPCREQGIIVLNGDVTDPALLRKAGVQRARALISLCGDDGVNADVAVQAYELVGVRQGTALTCVVHIVDPQLCSLLREREIEMGKADAFRMEFFNVFDSGARALLQEVPPFGPAANTRPHLLVVGLGRMGESLVIQAAKAWGARPRRSAKKMRITVLDLDPVRKIESVCLRYPRLPEVCELQPLAIDVRWPEFERAAFLSNSEGKSDLTAVYICLDDESLSLSVGLTLHRRLQGQHIPIVVRTRQDSGLTTLLKGVDGGRQSFEDLHAFPLLDRTCSPGLVLNGAHEVIARAIHQDYLRSKTMTGTAAGMDPAQASWDELDEAYRESCRRQADHLGLKLRAVGCGIAPLADWNSTLFTFTPEQVEQMARMEHERWMAERRRGKWSLGSRNSSKKTNPNLLPWEQLPEDIREFNRDLVRGIPEVLARAGVAIVQSNH